MVERKVVWTETAARQRRLILEYWVQRNQSTSYSLKLLDASDKKTSFIATNPNAYRKSEFSETRVAAFGHYSIFYRITPATIVITAFWDNRQRSGLPAYVRHLRHRYSFSARGRTGGQIRTNVANVGLQSNETQSNPEKYIQPEVKGSPFRPQGLHAVIPAFRSVIAPIPYGYCQGGKQECMDE